MEREVMTKIKEVQLVCLWRDGDTMRERMWKLEAPSDVPEDVSVAVTSVIYEEIADGR